MANTAAITLITRCLDYVSRAAVGTTRSGQTLSDMAVSWLNTAMRRVSREFDFREMYRRYSGYAADGDKIYAWPTTWKVILDLTLLDGSTSMKLINMRHRSFDKRMPNPENESESRPTHYMPIGNNFEIFPIPDVSTYQLKCRCIVWPTTITTTTTADDIEYEDTKDDMILAFMLSQGYGFLGMLSDASRWEKIAVGRLKEEIELELRQPDWEKKAIGFDSRYENFMLGDYYNDPFIWRNP